MPYHAVAIGIVWSELSPASQILFLALIRVAGGGLLATGIAGSILLAIPFRANANWSRWALLVVGLAVGIPTLYATLTVQFRTPASPPWIVTAIGVLFILLGFLFSFGRYTQNSSQKPKRR